MPQFGRDPACANVSGTCGIFRPLSSVMIAPAGSMQGSTAWLGRCSVCRRSCRRARRGRRQWQRTAQRASRPLANSHLLAETARQHQNPSPAALETRSIIVVRCTHARNALGAPPALGWQTAKLYQIVVEPAVPPRPQPPTRHALARTVQATLPPPVGWGPLPRPGPASPRYAYAPAGQCDGRQDGVTCVNLDA